MILRMVLSLLPTAKNKESYKRDQQLAYLIAHEPSLFQNNPESDLSDRDISHLQSRIELEPEKMQRRGIHSFYTALYSKITQRWDKGLDALTDVRRAELLRSCRKNP